MVLKQCASVKKGRVGGLAAVRAYDSLSSSYDDALIITIESIFLEASLKISNIA
jgi:hypothetical protein